MPLVCITWKVGIGNKTYSFTPKEMARELCGIVAEALNTSEPGWQLSPNDIEVRIDHHPIHQGSEHTYLNAKDFEVVIWASESPERKANLNERRLQIAERLKPFLPEGVTGYVWILLVPGSFGEFQT